MVLEIGEGHLSHFVSFTAGHPKCVSGWNGNFLYSKFGERGDDQLREPEGLSISVDTDIIVDDEGEINYDKIFSYREEYYLNLVELVLTTATLGTEVTIIEAETKVNVWTVRQKKWPLVEV